MTCQYLGFMFDVDREDRAATIVCIFTIHCREQYCVYLRSIHTVIPSNIVSAQNNVKRKDALLVYSMINRRTDMQGTLAHENVSYLNVMLRWEVVLRRRAGFSLIIKALI